VVKVSTSSTSSSTGSITPNDKSLSDFLYGAIKTLIDGFLVELNKSLVKGQALRIDKHLSHEIFKHQQRLRSLRDSPSQSRQKSNQAKFDQLVTDYVKAKTAHPLVLFCSDESSESGESQLPDCSHLVAHWLANFASSAKSSSQACVYRFAGHTVLASRFSTLMQSIWHQLTYLMDCHESWAFDSSDQLSDNIIKLMAFHKAKSQGKPDSRIIFK
jgi:hypothetical protein